MCCQGVLPEPERGNERRRLGARGANWLSASVCSDMLIGTSVSPLSPVGDLTLPPEGRSLFASFPLALEGPETLPFLPMTVTSGP